MQRKNGKRMQIDQVMRWAVTIIIALIFVSAFFVIDSPKVAKQKKIDTQTLNDVQNVDASINAYFAQTGSLPSSLDVLDKTTFSPGLAMQNIKYKIINGNRYQLCAEFKRSNFTDTEAQEKFLSQWKHEAGNYCFERITVSKGENVKGNFDNFIPAIPVK